MDYSRILTRSFEVTWKHRAMWLFGILLALFGGGGGGGGGFPTGAGGNSGNRGADSFPNQFPQLTSIDWGAVSGIIAVVICVVLILAIVGIILRLISRGALVGLVDELESSQTTPSVGRGFRIGWSRLRSLLGIAILINLPLTLFGLILLALAALPVLGALTARGDLQFNQILAMGGMSSLLFLLCAILCLAGIGLVIKPIYEFIVRACVVGEHNAMDSIREGWRIVRLNLGSVVVLYILQIALGIGFGIAMIPVALILIGIPVVVGLVIYFLANAPMVAIIVGVIVGIPMVLILIWISGLYRAFETTMWTEGYLHAAK